MRREAQSPNQLASNARKNLRAAEQERTDVARARRRCLQRVTVHGRQRVSSLLEEAGLDWFAIEAEALNLVMSDMERIDRNLVRLRGLRPAPESASDRATLTVARF
jgi:hypothetical protein